MSNLMQSVDDRTRLAGTNQVELLLFSLGEDSDTGRDELFGINVFKVREVMNIPEITTVPDMPEAVEGMVSLRGVMVPVINLPKFCGIHCKEKPEILIITEYNKQVQGFIVHSVNNIQRLGWDQVKSPPPMISARLSGLVTAIAQLDDQRLVIIVDVEKILAETGGLYEDESIFEGIDCLQNTDITILFADDSIVARSQIKKTLDHMGFHSITTVNGAEAWAKLNELADAAELAQRTLKDDLQLILTDVEMPEMDGYVLTRKVKADPRFNGIPVVMHSSLTSDTNQILGKSVGADAYVPKFQPRELANSLLDILHGESGP